MMIFHSASRYKYRETKLSNRRSTRSKMWVTKYELLDMIKEGLFIPYRNSLIEFIFEMNIGLGTIRE